MSVEWGRRAWEGDPRLERAGGGRVGQQQAGEIKINGKGKAGMEGGGKEGREIRILFYVCEM